MKIIKKKDGEKEWTNFLDFEKGTQINDFDVFKDFIAIYVKLPGGQSQILVYDIASDTARAIEPSEQPGELGEIEPGLNQDYDTGHMRFSYTSPFVF